MKNEEDEAFDELAKRQGAWGGGFKAKQAMAADKLQEPVREVLKLALEALEEYADHEGKTRAADEAITAIKEALAQPAQEPDWKEQYEYQKRRAEMWIAKYEKDIGPLEKVQPAQEPVAGEHITDGSPCWCEPETIYTDPETFVSVIVHKEPQ